MAGHAWLNGGSTPSSSSRSSAPAEAGVDADAARADRGEIKDVFKHKEEEAERHGWTSSTAASATPRRTRSGGARRRAVIFKSSTLELTNRHGLFIYASAWTRCRRALERALTEAGTPASPAARAGKLAERRRLRVGEAVLSAPKAPASHRHRRLPLGREIERGDDASAADGSVAAGSSGARAVGGAPAVPARAAQRERGSSGKAQWPNPKPKVSIPGTRSRRRSPRHEQPHVGFAQHRVSWRPPLASIAKNSARSRAEPTSELQPHESDVGPPAVSCHSSVASVASRRQRVAAGARCLHLRRRAGPPPPRARRRACAAQHVAHAQRRRDQLERVTPGAAGDALHHPVDQHIPVAVVLVLEPFESNPAPFRGVRVRRGPPRRARGPRA